MAYLKESHPEKAEDLIFVINRGDQAAQEYSQSIINGYTHTAAAEVANEVLFQGLHFSPFDTIKKVIREQFTFIPEENILLYALTCFPELQKEIFYRYEFTDTFDETPLYHTLYAEITGWITINIEENGL